MGLHLALGLDDKAQTDPIAQAPREQPQPEATPEPGGDYQLGLYANAVVELDASVDMWFIENDYNHKFTPEQTVRRWRDHVNYSTGQDHEFEAYISAVRELVPDIEEQKIKHYRDLGYTPEQAAKRWRGYCRFLQESKKR